jgi:hypothetical protein
LFFGVYQVTLATSKIILRSTTSELEF